MLNTPEFDSVEGLTPDADAALLLRKLAVALVGVAVLMGTVLLVGGNGVRPAVVVAMLAGFAMLVLLRTGRVRAAAYVLCWGLLAAGSVGIYKFGLRSTGALVIPLAIMSGGWLLGRFAAISLAVTGSLMSAWVYLEYTQGKIRGFPIVIESDLIAHVAIFTVTSMLGAAMAKTLRLQYARVSALAKGLQEANITLEARVAERSAQLVTLQQRAMDAEKLTSLGSMVAGISHELNTPLGNALTVSSTMEEQVRTLSQQVASGKLTRTDMAEFLARAADMAQLTTESVRRAAGLVASFKQVAVDQTSEQRRPFQLRDVIASNIAALWPSIKRVDLAIEIHGLQDVACEGYPGPLGQVVTNLIQNAVVHGFDSGMKGRIAVSAFTKDERVFVEVADDGKGMTPKVLARVFEPFFTTRLGKGGSGLGLSVSHRIATSVLGGDLTAVSEQGKGSTFTLSFPIRLSTGL